VAHAAMQPVVVTVYTATPLDLSSVLANSKVGAVLHLGQPSVALLGIGDLIFGNRVPAGRMIQTVYEAAYQDQISIFDFGMRPGPSPFARPDCTDHKVSRCKKGTNPGRTYRFYTGKPVVPFGFGLSYTSFSYTVAKSPTSVSLGPLAELLATSQGAGEAFVRTDALQRASARVSWSSQVQYMVNVTNTGKRDADDVVLGFLVPPGAGQNGIPLRVLFGFERVHIKAGEMVSVSLYPALVDFAQAGADGKLVAHPGTYHVYFGVAETSPHGMGYAEAGELEAEVSERVII